jgi:hypothetical protein
MSNWKRSLLLGVSGLLTCVALSAGLMTAVTSASLVSLSARVTLRDKVLAPTESPAPTNATQDEDKTYKKPRWKDQRLDWCFNWGRDCGQPPADHFCRRHLFSGAKDFRAEPNVGSYEPTRLAGSDQVCNQPFCTGFEYITCFGPISLEQKFTPPVWHNYRLDWCLNWEKDCGKPAADAFCKANGFLEAIFYEADPGVGTQPTMLMGSGQICNAKFCTAFQIITCKSGKGKPLGKAKPPPQATPTPAPGIKKIQTPPIRKP